MVEMTWGQKSMLRQLIRDRPPHHFNAVSSFAIPDDLSDAGLRKIIASVIESHTVLRTRFHWSEDAAAGTQSLVRAYALPLDPQPVSGAEAEIEVEVEVESDPRVERPHSTSARTCPSGPA